MAKDNKIERKILYDKNVTESTSRRDPLTIQNLSLPPNLTP